MSGTAVLDFVQPDAVNLLKKNSSGLARWEAPALICGIRQFVSLRVVLYAENNTSRNTLARRAAAPRAPFAAIPFIPANFSVRARARARGGERRGREIARFARFSLSLSLGNTKETALTRRVYRHARVYSRVFLPARDSPLCQAPTLARLRAIASDLHIGTANTRGCALITRRGGLIDSEVKVAGRARSPGSFCKFRYFIVPGGAFNFPLLRALTGGVYGASRTFDKL